MKKRYGRKPAACACGQRTEAETDPVEVQHHHDGERNRDECFSDPARQAANHGQHEPGKTQSAHLGGEPSSPEEVTWDEHREAEAVIGRGIREEGWDAMQIPKRDVRTAAVAGRKGSSR